MSGGGEGPNENLVSGVGVEEALSARIKVLVLRHRLLIEILGNNQWCRPCHRHQHQNHRVSGKKKKPK
jgi:hypothetical protein